MGWLYTPRMALARPRLPHCSSAHLNLRAELDDAIARLSGPRAAELARVPTAPLAAEHRAENESVRAPLPHDPVFEDAVYTVYTAGRCPEAALSRSLTASRREECNVIAQITKTQLRSSECKARVWSLHWTYY